uniref:Uncharacterized protein n=1 Tax=Acrobeloides nanus TaxID=290746 RepID=A0A914D4Y3_9BILA
MAVDDLKYQCGCGSRHVSQGAVVIAWIKIAISSIGYAGCCFLFGWYNIVPLLIAFAICGMVIYGNKQEKSWMYLPFLILESSE